jgi:hypothetical protein
MNTGIKRSDIMIKRLFTNKLTLKDYYYLLSTAVIFIIIIMATLAILEFI